MGRRFLSILRRAAASALVLVLALPAVSGAETAGAEADLDLLLAGNAIRALDVKGPDGETLVPRRAEEMRGRGKPDSGTKEPDYVGVVGYATLTPSEKIGSFSTFDRTPWVIPAYEREGDKWSVSGAVLHKTPVVVVDQVLRPGPDRDYRGYLQVIRLDRNELIWLKVNQFVTVPYWTLPAGEAVNYGNFIAVYRNASRHDPKERSGRSGSIPDGMHILLCDRGDSRYTSPDSENNPFLGVFFPGRGETETGTFLFFGPADLTIVY